LSSIPRADPDLRVRLDACAPLVGTVLTLGDVALTELAAAPMDLVWVDLEHGALDVADVQRMAIACRAAETAILVRVPTSAADRLAAILDVGIDGVVVPRIESEAQAREAVATLRYPPAGSRGYGPRRAGAYGRQPRTDSRLACLAQIETAAGVGAARDIAAVDGIDALVLGPADLSFDLGVALQLDAPDVRAAAAAVAVAAKDASKPLVVAGSQDVLIRLGLANGQASVLVCSVDVRVYATALDRIADEARTALTAARAPA